MTEEEYNRIANAVARKLSIAPQSSWTTAERLPLLLNAMPIEVLEYVAQDPPLAIGKWAVEWIEGCRQEILNRELEEIILLG